MITSGALALLAVACGPAEEPTATSAPEPTATAEPTATSPPEVAEPTATPQEVARQEAEATPTPTPGTQRGVEAAGRPELTMEKIDRLDKMGTKEVLELFPAAYPAEWDFDDIQKGGTFRAAITWDISIWDTRKAAAGGTTSTANVVYERLVQYEQGPGRDPNNPAIVDDLAEAWEYNEDGTQLTFKLKKGVYWGDVDDPFQKGPEVTAEDIKFILLEYRDGSVQAGAYKSMTSVDTPDKYTVVMNFESPAYFILPFLASKDATMFNPELARQDRMRNELVGPGAFILTEAKKSQFVELKRNPNHFMKDAKGNQLPYLDGVKFLITPEINTRIALLRTQKVDYAASVAQRVEQVQRILKTNPDLIVTAVAGDARGWVVSPQLNNPMFQDANVRRALVLAHDERGISDVIWGGRGVPADPKYEWWHYRDTLPSWDEDLDEAWGPYANHYDLERAKELWAQAGLSEMSLKLPYYAYGEYISDMLGLLVDDWRKLGITLKPQSQDYSDYNSTLQTASQEQMILSWQQQAYDPIGIALTRLTCDGGGNRENVCDPRLEDLSDQLVGTADPAKQRELVNQLRDVYLEQVYFFSLSDSAFSFTNIVQPWVKGVRGGQNAYLSYYYQGPILRQVWMSK